MSHEAAPPGRLRREYVLNPITALAFLAVGEKRCLLAAEDTDIRVYDVATSQLFGVLPVFRAQPIHGISVPPTGDDASNLGARRGPPRILVWGGHTIKVLPACLVEELVYAGSSWDDTTASGDAYGQPGLVSAALSLPETSAPDWIFDGRISPFDGDHIVLLTAHNDIIHGQVSTDERTLVLGQVRSPSRPILYSGNLSWVERDCVLVAAGTVFGEIVVWKCHLDSNIDYERDSRTSGAGTVEETTGCEVLFVFSGHEGSIFGVHISPETPMNSGENVRLLASCSDDRTIRIWDITERGNESASEVKGYEAQISDVRQTGFGDSITSSTELGNSHPRCIATAMGHISRIWQVEIQSRRPVSGENTIEVYSFGEDATMQRWHLEVDASLRPTINTNGGSQFPFKLTHDETLSHHSGKQIWSHAMMSDECSLLIATGGGDGKVALVRADSVRASRVLDNADDVRNNIGYIPQSIWEVEVSPMYLIEKCENLTLETTSSISSFKHGNGKEVFQSFTFISDDKLLITTRSGRLFLGNFYGLIEWKELTIPDVIRKSIQSYTILRSSRRASMAFVGAPNGELFYYHEASGNSLWPIHKAERKITDIICISDTQASSGNVSDEYIELLVTVFGSVKAELLRLNQDRVVIRRMEIIIPDKFIVTAVAWCHGHLVIGSRNGDMSIFDLTPNGGCSPRWNIKGKTGDKITHILPLPQRCENSPRYFATCARDGKYRIYQILDTAGEFQIRLLHETKPPFGPLIEGSWLFDKPDGKQDLMLCGFRSQYFIVWNVTQQSEVAKIDCGGGHRIFDQVQIRENPEGFRFACTKASQMKIFSQTRAPHLPLKTGGHGREIKSVSASGRYVATGAEDTMIRIWELCEGPQRRGGEEKLRCMLALEKHNTGIQKLKWSKDQYLFSSGGNEEFFVWRITPLESDICRLGVVCAAVFPDRSEVGDLRITDFDVQCLSDDETEGINIGSTAASRTEQQFCISMTLSNSTVQSYLYSEQHGFRLLGRRVYTGACLTQIRHLNFTDRCYPQVLAAATDGHLAVFTDVRHCDDGAGDSTGILVTKLHQSSIKALDMRTVATEAGTSYLVVTGGDDDAVGVLHLYLPPHASAANSGGQAHIRFGIRNKFMVRSAHAAAVTGVGIVRLENEERDAVVVTASNDQRVKTWRLVGWQSASPRVHLLDDRYSGVADAGDLEVVSGRSCEDGNDEGLPGREKGGRVLVAGVGIEAWAVS